MKRERTNANGTECACTNATESVDYEQIDAELAPKTNASAETQTQTETETQTGRYLVKLPTATASATAEQSVEEPEAGVEKPSPKTKKLIAKPNTRRLHPKQLVRESDSGHDW